MVFYSEVGIENIIIHTVGNKLKGDSILLSNSTIIMGSELESSLLQHFIKPFLKSNEYYTFDNIEINEIYQAVRTIFRDYSSFVNESKKIANNLFHIVRNPKIVGGHLFIVLFNGCIVNDNMTNGIGIFKTETIDTIIKINPSNERFEVETERGVNINKLTKGCIIFNEEEDNGYIVSIVDKKITKDDVGYWLEDFLNLKPYKDNYYFTKSTLDCIGNFVFEQLPANFDIAKVSQIDLLNKTVDYCLSNDNFILEDYSNEVLESEEVIEKFNDYKEYYMEHNQLEEVINFEIDKSAVKNKIKDFKSVIKLDDRFDIILHKDTENLIRGKDEMTGMDYYQLFFKVES